MEPTGTEEKKERALAISVMPKGTDRDLAMEYLDELEFLAETAGAEVIEKVYQELAKPNPSTVVGKGKLEDIKEIVTEEKIDLIIFDDDLSPAQVRNIEKALEIKVLDRSGLILDIFAIRAKTIIAKTQVELAQLQYTLPRLTRMWTHLSKQYGGIGTKGPGETQIETDRRIIRTRIQRLKEKLEGIETQKEQQRKGRERLPRFALVGYTNAGKSTLMNLLTDADVYTEDKLFATLDTTVRKMKLSNNHKALISDTVGFIRKLPPHLVASFKTTLVEAKNADILLHVVDVTNAHFKEHIKVVNETLQELNIDPAKAILVFNKIDLSEDIGSIALLENEYDTCIRISAKRGINISGLVELMTRKYEEQSKTYIVILPYAKSSLEPKLYEFGDILTREDSDTGTTFKIKIIKEKTEHFLNIFSNYLLDD